MNAPAIQPETFVACCRPLLEKQDASALAALVKSRWTARQLVGLLHCSNGDARKVAALVLGIVGDQSCVPELVRLLHEPDPLISELVEHALWSIWFRSGTPEANHQLHRGTLAMGRRDMEHALSHFERAIAIDPTFAEAFNQRAIVYYLLEDFTKSADDCRQTITLNPDHFGAWAGLGHCLAYQGDLRGAINAYSRALKINPHLECVRQLLAELREQESSA